MGQILVEDNLEFDFRPATNSVRFDDEVTHGLSHCMKRVDFIIETADTIIFIEIKDPDNPKARPVNVSQFLQQLRSNSLITNALVPKARDSFLYNHLLNRLPPGKARIYIVLIACANLLPPELLALTDSLKQHLPLVGPFKQTWSQLYFDSCFVTNFSRWNRTFPQFPVTRIP